MIKCTNKLNSYLLKTVAQKARYFHLFVNPIENLGSDVILDDFKEPYGESYQRADIEDSFEMSNGKICWKELSFTIPFACDVYGYFITDNRSNVLWYGQFDYSPIRVSIGDAINITPSFQID